MSQAGSLRRPGILKNESTDPPTMASANLSVKDLTASPKSTPKSVSIAPKGELISPLILGTAKDVDDMDLDRTQSPRRPRIKSASSRRMSGRPAQQSSIGSLQQWLDEANDSNDAESSTGHSERHLFEGGIVGQIAAWIRDEKVKRDARRVRRQAKPSTAHTAAASHPEHHVHHESHLHQPHESRPRSDSQDSVDLDQLEQIIKESFPFGRKLQRKLSSTRRRSSVRKLQRSASIAASSDTEFVDGDVLVPSAEVVLDNSNTLSYKGGAAATSSDDLSLTREPTVSEDAWVKFKFEVLRVVHTLRLKGWRRVPLAMSSDISIDRLSGALTNAVYVVSPPHNLPDPPAKAGDESDKGHTRPAYRRPPPKLLLRIYGPQVEHLIDREAELQILRRLARKHIGPRMLGTFQNGRFEEFFNAATLTPDDLRNPDTSRHIAKRMRELHDGVDLLDSERQEGPFVWSNWDKWLARVQKIAEWLDSKLIEEASGLESHVGFVCGTPWATFHDTLFKYRKWLTKQYGGEKVLAELLVFAHNDTQYGNILRMLPSETSPLLLPANSHKQLVVIDFEYANANTIGLEFANHFSEWCYNYHDETRAWACTHTLYPTPEDQERFLRAYVRHRPEFNVSTPRMEALNSVPEDRSVSPHSPRDTRPSGTPVTSDGTTSESSRVPTRPAGPSQSISNFMLDARNPTSTLSPISAAPSTLLSPRPSSGKDSSFALGSAGGSTDSFVALAEDAQVKKLMEQTRLWRMANSAQWVAWGIVQAKIPGLGEVASDGTVVPAKPEAGVDMSAATAGQQPLTAEEKALVEKEEEEEADSEFDYLAYARDRAMLFWGDAVDMGFIKLDELPADVQKDIKMLNY